MHVSGSVFGKVEKFDPHTALLKEKAVEMEAAFLSEMLGYANLGTTLDSFGGGAGEDQFASILRDEQSKMIARKGGIGLAEMLFEAMIKSEANVKNV